jgi:hypothetical protein
MYSFWQMQGSLISPHIQLLLASSSRGGACPTTEDLFCVGQSMLDHKDVSCAKSAQVQQINASLR